MNLSLMDTLPFGKHKGKTIKEVLSQAPSYLVWLRETRRKENADIRFFSEGVSMLLDDEIRGNPSLQKNYKPWREANVQPVQVTEQETFVEHAYTEWGQF